MESTLTKTRDTTFDSIKFVLIFFVVFAHTFQINMCGVNARLFSFINSFHMPAFILVSGFFYKDSDSKKFWRGILELFLVILVFQIISFSWGWLDPFDFSWEGIWNRVSHLYLPRRALWYILSLCFWRLFMRYYPSKVRENYKITLPISIIVSLLVGFIPIRGEFSFQRTFTFFPFFLMGYYMHKYNLWDKIRGIKNWMCITVIVIYFLVILLIPNFPDSMLTGSFHYWSGLGGWKKMFLLRVASYFWMIPLTICVLNVIPNCKFLAEQGENTMFYFLYHPYFIWLMHWCVVKFNAPTSTLFLFLYTAVSLFAMYWLSKIPVLNFLTKPITTIRSKK